MTTSLNRLKEISGQITELSQGIDYPILQVPKLDDCVSCPNCANLKTPALKKRSKFLARVWNYYVSRLMTKPFRRSLPYIIRHYYNESEGGAILDLYIGLMYKHNKNIDLKINVPKPKRAKIPDECIHNPKNKKFVKVPDIPDQIIDKNVEKLIRNIGDDF